MKTFLGLEKSKRLQQRAAALMPRGVSSNVRFWGEGVTLYAERAKGAYVWDVDGNRYIDYRLAFGPIILGHAYDAVDARVVERIRHGVSIGLTGELELSVAEKIIAMCPAVERVRFANSGTEATMHALRVARAYTGRERIIKFEGMYHGSHDYVLFSTYAPPEAYGNRRHPIVVPASSGIPRCLRDLVITLPFNDPELLERTLKSFGHEVAAIITEPMMGNFGSVEPLPGFLQFLRAQCIAYGILLIFDEVKTGFRIARGGAQEVYGVLPDLAAYAKSLGNGYPVAAFGGRADVMDVLGRGVTQGGTYNANGVAVAAADATLGLLQSEPILETIAARGRRLQTGLQEIFERVGLPAVISPHPAIFTISFGLEKPADARDWAASNREFYQRFAAAVLLRGVLLDHDPREPLCLCYSHSEADINETLAVMEDAAKAVKP